MLRLKKIQAKIEDLNEIILQNNKCIFLNWRKRLKLAIDEVYFLLIKTLLFTDG